MMLEASQVEKTFRDCLFNDGEDTTLHVEVKGIMVNVGFHPGRLASHHDEIVAMLDELPDEFKASGGGGWSFLNACNDKHDNLWTGSQQTMDELFMLGMGIDRVAPLLPREVWPVLPGGVPYYIITDDDTPPLGVLPDDLNEPHGQQT